MGNQTSKKGETPQKQESASDQIFNVTYEFKTMALNFKKEAAKAQKQEEKLRLKIKDAIEKNLVDSAKIYAEDAIRKRNEVKRYYIMSSKMDAIQSKLKEAYQTQQVNFIFIIKINLLLLGY
jgi:charged multivesicular body protein 1